MDQAGLPKLACHVGGDDLHIGPPRHLVALTMQIVVMVATQGHSELVADLATERVGLGELQMVGVARRSLADQARLFGYKSQMRFVASLDRFRHRVTV